MHVIVLMCGVTDSQSDLMMAFVLAAQQERRPTLLLFRSALMGDAPMDNQHAAAPIESAQHKGVVRE